MTLLLALIAFLLGLFLFWQSHLQRRASGLPAGRVIYTDTGGWNKVEKPLYHPDFGLTGKPDYIVKKGSAYIPVEVKSGWAPSTPYESHVFQLAAYCLLVEYSTHQRPPYGILQYRNRTIAIDYTPELENSLLDLLNEMRSQTRRGEADRSHDEPARCARCGYRAICEQRL